jgi:hypothetical protein
VNEELRVRYTCELGTTEKECRLLNCRPVHL